MEHGSVFFRLEETSRDCVEEARTYIAMVLDQLSGKETRPAPAGEALIAACAGSLSRLVRARRALFSGIGHGRGIRRSMAENRIRRIPAAVGSSRNGQGARKGGRSPSRLEPI